MVLVGPVLAGCATRYSETIDPNTGQVIAREFSTRADLNVVTTGALSSADQEGGLLGGLIPGDSRNTIVDQWAVDGALDATRPTLKVGEMEFYGTMVHSTPAAVAWRGLTGVGRELRKGIVRSIGLEAWKSERQSADAADTARAGIAAGTDQAGIQAEIAAGVETTRIITEAAP